MSLNVWRRYWTRLDGVEELFYLIVLAAEACVIYPWQLLISTFFGYRGMPFWGLCILLWVPYLIASLLNHSELMSDRKQALVAGLILLTALLAVWLHVYSGLGTSGVGWIGRVAPDLPAASTPRAGYPFWDLSWIAEMVDRLFNTFSVLPQDLLTIILVFVGWWRGIAASRRVYDTQQVWFHFRLGVIILVGYFIVTIFGRSMDLSALILAYFFFGLMSVALASLRELGGVHQSTLGSKQWIAVLAGSILGNLALALLASLLFSRQAVRTVLAWFQPLGRLLQQAAWYLVSFVLYLVWPLIEWALGWIKQMQAEGFTFAVSPLGSPMANPLQAMQTEEGTDLAPVCRTIFVILIVVGGLFLVVRMIRLLAQQQAERRDLERESLWSRQDVVDDLRNSLRQGWDQIKAFASQFGGRRRSAASIRKIYASMVDLATEAGYPRHRAETPYEYRSTLHEVFPGGEGAVDAITEAYVRVHYGEVPGTPAEMNQLVQYWEQIQRQDSIERSLYQEDSA